jgi:hypothetical protein
MKERSWNVYENKGPLWKTRAEAGIHLVFATWTPAYAGVTPLLSFPWVGSKPVYTRNASLEGYFRSR